MPHEHCDTGPRELTCITMFTPSLETTQRSIYEYEVSKLRSLNARAHRARVVPKNTNPPRDCAALNNVHTKLGDNAEVHIRIRSFQAGPRATQSYPGPDEAGMVICTRNHAVKMYWLQYFVSIFFREKNATTYSLFL